MLPGAAVGKARSVASGIGGSSLLAALLEDELVEGGRDCPARSCPRSPQAAPGQSVVRFAEDRSGGNYGSETSMW